MGMIYKKDIAYNAILEKINSAEYPAQTYIDEQVLAEELNTSRTPIREALMELAKEGYIEILPKRGIIVLPFTYQNAMDIFQTRTLIEPWLIETYGPDLTKEELEKEYDLIKKEIDSYPIPRERPGASIKHHPHSLLFDHCTNQLVLGIMEDMEKQSLRTPNERPVSKKYLDELDRDDLIKNHNMLVDLMLDGKFSEAAEEMRKHIAVGQSEYMNYWFG